jgi:hypothetical protein
MTEPTTGTPFDYRIAVLAGTALIALVFVTIIMHLDISVSQTILAVFGATLFVTPVIAKISLNKEGFELQTVKAAEAIEDALKSHGKAISTLTDNLDHLAKSLEEVRTVAETKNGDIAGGKAEWPIVLKEFGPKISVLENSLATTRGLIQESEKSTAKVGDILVQLKSKRPL